jgi:hypothetical protein
MSKNKVKYFLILLYSLCQYTVHAQDTIVTVSKGRDITLAINGSFTASKNFDIARHLTTRSIGGEVGLFLFSNTMLSLSYEMTKINEYDAKFKELNFGTIALKQLLPLSNKFHATTALSAGQASGKYINFGIDSQGNPEFDASSKHLFLELGARYTANKKLFAEIRFLQIGYINKNIEKQFPSNIKDFVVNDDEYFPVRLTIGIIL